MAATKAYGVPVRRSEPLRLSMHPDAPSQGQYRSWMLGSDRPLAIDLFSGAGGLSYGLEAAGYRVALAVDFDDWALETHAHNFEGVALQLDLGDPGIRDSIVTPVRWGRRRACCRRAAVPAVLTSRTVEDSQPRQ